MVVFVAVSEAAVMVTCVYGLSVVRRVVHMRAVWVTGLVLHLLRAVLGMFCGHEHVMLLPDSAFSDPGKLNLLQIGKMSYAIGFTALAFGALSCFQPSIFSYVIVLFVASAWASAHRDSFFFARDNYVIDWLMGFYHFSMFVVVVISLVMAAKGNPAAKWNILAIFVLLQHYGAKTEVEQQNFPPEVFLNTCVCLSLLSFVKAARVSVAEAGMSILFAESNPPGTILSLSSMALREMQGMMPKSFHVVPAATWKNLQKRIQEVNPTILHVWAHGERDGDFYGLILSDNDQLSIEVQRKMGNYLVTPDQLAKLIKQGNRIEYVILSVCNSAPFVEAVYRQNPHVKCVGFNDLVKPTYMSRWCVGFYSSLLAGKNFYASLKNGLANIEINPVYKAASSEEEEYGKFKAAMVIKPLLTEEVQ